MASVSHELVYEVSQYSGYYNFYGLNLLDLPAHRKVISYKDLSFYNKSKLTYLDTAEKVGEFIKNSDLNHVYYVNPESIELYNGVMDHNLDFRNHEAKLLYNIKLRKQSWFVNSFSNYIKGKCSVAIHVRRGDFVKIGCETNDDFFVAAINYFIKTYENVEFFIFSDDLTWVRDKFGSKEKFHYVKNVGYNYADWEEFFCIAQCRFAILSENSGYGRMARRMARSEVEGDGYSVSFAGTENNGKTLLLQKRKGYYNVCEELIIEENSKKLINCADRGDRDKEKLLLALETDLEEKNWEIALQKIDTMFIDAYDLSNDDFRKLIKLKYRCFEELDWNEAAMECHSYLINNFHVDINRSVEKEKQQWYLIPQYPYIAAQMKGFQKLAYFLSHKKEVIYWGGESNTNQYAKDALLRDTNLWLAPYCGAKNKRKSGLKIFNHDIKNIVVTVTSEGVDFAKQNNCLCIFMDLNSTMMRSYFTKFPFKWYFFIRHSYETVNFHTYSCYKKADIVITNKKKKYIKWSKKGKKVIYIYDLVHMSKRVEKYRYVPDKIEANGDGINDTEDYEINLLLDRILEASEKI